MPRNTEEQPIFQRAGQLLTARLEGIRLGQHTLETGNLTIEPLAAAQQLIVGEAHRQPQVFRQHHVKDTTRASGWEELTQRRKEPQRFAERAFPTTKSTKNARKGSSHAKDAKAANVLSTLASLAAFA